ncbi:MAG: hypothetical protein ACKVUS_20875 [Saprospiraceae bacterium]
MIIANPIYDAVFKYLLEDADIARELLSIIIGEEIVSLTIQPQETATESATGSISIFRLDFKAVVRTAEGGTKKVLIELQKAKQLFDVMRFRRYLGDNYRKEDHITDEAGNTEMKPLPILTIYFLGFQLPNVKIPVLKVNRRYRDAVTQEEISVREEFVELLTHDSFVIQIPRLNTNLQTRLEAVLQVFNQQYKEEEDWHKLNFLGDESDPLVAKMLARLNRAVASDELRVQMEVDDEIERIFDREVRKKLIAQEEKHHKTIEEKDKALEERDKTIEEKNRLIEMLQKQLGNHKN